MSVHTWILQDVIHYSLVKGNGVWSNRVYWGADELVAPTRRFINDASFSHQWCRANLPFMRRVPQVLEEPLGSLRLIVLMPDPGGRLAQRTHGEGGIQPTPDFHSSYRSKSTAQGEVVQPR